jgi:hypothetical protein
MKRAFAIVMVLIAAVTVLPAIASACSCVQIPASDEAMTDFYRNRFDGAAFTGKVKSVREIPGFSDDADSRMREIIVDVDQFWKGVSTPEMKIYTDSGRTSCSLSFEKDKEYFFLPNLWKGHLFSGMCDFSNYRGKYPEKEWSDFTESVFGPAKSFSKTN